jgi:Gram-negative porin
MKKTRLAAVATGVVLAAATQLAAAAKGPEYTYADLGYVHTDGDDINGNGAKADISFGATKHIFLKFGYRRDQFDVTGVTSSIDANSFLIGGGAHYTVLDKLDLVGSLSYIDSEYSGAIPKRGDDGYEARLGVRSLLTKKFELNAFAAFVSQKNLVDTDTSDTVYSLGGVYKLNKDFSLVGNISSGDNANDYGVGIRLGL